MYGPTEATCGATIKRLLPHQTVNIGRPVPSMRVYVLDRRQSFVPPGVIGEIYLAGVQVSRGYVDMPQETAESFMPDSVCPELGESMYRTGDCGYWDNHGELIFLGRNDRQIKLRGFRLDLNDLETRMLRAVPEVTALAVVQKMDFLVAVIQPKSLNISAFRSEIAKVLPLYALPRHVMAVDHLPITSTGKLDYKAIANTSYAQNTLSTSLSRSSPSICQMAAIWREVLGLGSDVLITGDSNLIELGGSSVQQMLLSSRLTATLKRRIPLRLVVASPSLGDLVKATEDLDSLADMTDSAQRSLGDYELSPIERDWWNKYEMGQRCSAFNVSFACKLGASINLSTLTSAWNMVLAHHRILSCKYSVHRRSGVRRVYADHPPIVERVDRLDVWQEVNRPFDLRRSSPIRVTISTDCMVATISHIICDLTTLRVLLLEVAAAYNGSPLKPAQNAYVDTTLLSDTAAPCKFDFWTRYLQRAPDCQYAIGKPRDRTSYGGSSHVSKIVAGTFNDMMNFAVVHKVTFHQLSLAAVALALHHDSAPHDIIIGAPYLNRKFDEDIETIGLFLEPLPIRVRYPPSPAQHDFGQSSDSDFNSHPDSRFEPESFIHSVRRSSQAALTNAVPWHLLLKHLDTAPDFPNHPLFDVMVTFHDDRYETNLSLPHVEPLYTWSQGAKFKLMTEFLAINTATLLLRIEYDTECFDAREIKLLHGFIVAALGLLTAGMGYEEMKERMRSLHEQGIGGAELSEELEGDSGSYFGAELNAL